MDLRPPLEAAQDAFAPDAPAVVTVPGSDPVEVPGVFWLPEATVEVPAGGGMQRAEVQRVLVLPLATLPQVPRGTLVEMPAADGLDAATWRVDSAERHGFDHYRAMVLPEPE